MSWTLDGTSGLAANGNAVTYAPGKDGQGTVSALWADGEPVKSGESYWTVKFGNLTEGAWVGVTSKDRIKKGYGTKGLFYGGNLSDGGGLLVGNFGPRIATNDNIGLLASFTSDNKLKIFIYLNGKPLGLTFDVPATAFPSGVYPTVKFNSGAGSATIQKETTIPQNRTRQSATYSGIEGPWKAEAGSIKIDGQAPPTSNLPTIKLDKVGGNKYKVFLRVLNNINFAVEKTDKSWKSAAGAATTLMGGPAELLQLESALTNLCTSPDSVTVDPAGNRMTVTKGNSAITFVRFDDTPPPYSGNPFQ